MPSSRWTVRGVLAVAVVVVAACTDAPPTASTPPIPSQDSGILLSRTGKRVEVARMRDNLREVTREVAVALADDGLRAKVYASLHASPYREHKLHFATYLRGDGTALLAAMARARSPGVADHSPGATSATSVVLATLDEVLDLEFYMPVRTHFEAWDGGRELVIASALFDHETPVGFDLNGRSVALREDAPPQVPTLVLIRVETDFSKPAPSPQTVARSAAVDPPGVYMTSSTISDPGSYEGWTAGDPEFEVHTFVTDPSGTFVDRQCAGNEQAAPYKYDQNGGTWTGRVRLILADQIGFNQAHTEVWEDDYTACNTTHGLPPNTTDETIHQIRQLTPKIFKVKDPPNPVLQFIKQVAQMIFDFFAALNHDDPVGVLDNTGPADGCWNADGPTDFWIRRPSDNQIVGSVKLDVTFGEHVPICPLQAAISGPDEASTWYGAYYQAMYSFGTGPVSYEWYDNGEFRGTAGDYYMSPMTVGLHTVSVKVTRGSEFLWVSKNTNVVDGCTDIC